MTTPQPSLDSLTGIPGVRGAMLANRDDGIVVSGDLQAVNVAKTQPAKLAAFEGLYATEERTPRREERPVASAPARTNEAEQSEYADLAGIPVALLGLVSYCVMLGLILWEQTVLAA